MFNDKRMKEGVFVVPTTLQLTPHLHQ